MYAVVPAVKSTFAARAVASMICEVGKVTKKSEAEVEIKPVITFVTEIGWYVAPVGTVTVSCVAVAAVTAALTAPNHTILFAAVVLKFVPVIVTVVPMGPEVGEKDEIAGINGPVIVFRSTETELLPEFVRARSGFPSPSMSPIAKPIGFVPVVKSTLAANEPDVIEPEVLVFL